MNKKRKKHKSVRSYKPDRRAILGLLFVLACAVCVIVLVQLYLHKTIDKYEKNVIIKGVSIGTTDVSGMTKEEAKSAVLADTESCGQEQLILTLENGNQGEATLAELGLTVNAVSYTHLPF